MERASGRELTATLWKRWHLTCAPFVARPFDLHREESGPTLIIPHEKLNTVVFYRVFTLELHLKETSGM